MEQILGTSQRTGLGGRAWALSISPWVPQTLGVECAQGLITENHTNTAQPLTSLFWKGNNLKFGGGSSYKSTKLFPTHHKKILFQIFSSPIKKVLFSHCFIGFASTARHLPSLSLSLLSSGRGGPVGVRGVYGGEQSRSHEALSSCGVLLAFSQLQCTGLRDRIRDFSPLWDLAEQITQFVHMEFLDT